MPHSDVLIVGGGPAGVAAALSLRKAGVQRVTLLDREASLGGATRHCSHSPFGMLEYGRLYFGAAYGRRLERDARAAGVEVLTGHSVASLDPDGTVEVSNAEGLARLSAERVLLSTGARETPRSARMLPGDRPVGVLTTGALQSYVAFHGLMPFRRPVILGSELVSYSAALTCLSHGARPVAMIDTHARPLARAPVTWFPHIVGVPVRAGVRIIDILGRSRVEAVRIEHQGTLETFECDGLLVTGNFVPEAALLWQAGHELNLRSGGPAVDQNGRCANPRFFAAGNLLRPIETGGWAFREGRAIGLEIARDLRNPPSDRSPVTVTHDEVVKLVVPNLLRRGQAPSPGFDRFQIRFQKPCRGRLSLEVDGRTRWHRSGTWLPERRVLVPMPDGVEGSHHIHFAFREE
ncbi:NAD(P)/FAD-dependent oxidoreductase [Rubellimicrobium aerolatum]|uniref:FAD/NAD(P)-binding oxidoreductase n=1 Tax=Rubellimicrobium aerolatum TaxID=490979 RepID=A0ABW0SEV1_9RHOB|nr:FAD/NAD(P)-binding oxidoreductase [Rubellimicrobium aerolatum]MBP1806932.1 NADPH-dependent 2,4-dienoyl-CoA reductase/sulfur reductase-like enzyme [Rubellimicrobium aerolatum]